MPSWGALEAFHHLGATTKDKYSWSAQSEDRSVTVLTLWDDLIQDDGKTVVADFLPMKGVENFIDDRRHQNRTKHLKDVWEGNRTFRVIMVTARNREAVPRSTADRWPDDDLLMTLTNFDEKTGGFQASGQRSVAIAPVFDRRQSNGKYAPLGAFLKAQKAAEVTLSINEIGTMVKILPQDARTHQFWANATEHHASRRRHWLGNGFKAFYEPTTNSVRFSRAKPVTTNAGEGWTTDELLACVTAYRELWLAEQQGQRLNKSALRRRVMASALVGRSEGAYEKRMQNISAVIDELGLPTVPGYLPLRNIGGAKPRLIRLIAQLWDRQQHTEAATADEDELETRVQVARLKFENSPGPPPPGADIVERASGKVNRFSRNPEIIAWVLAVAGDRCEVCKERAPFMRADGSPYLEVHHVRPLALGGPDRAENAVAACPNCHRRLHAANDKDQQRLKLIKAVERLREYPKIALGKTEDIEN